MQKRIRHVTTQVVENNHFKLLVSIVIAVNFVVLVLETMPREMADYWTLLKVFDKIFLLFFVAELLMKIVAYGRQFFWPLRFWNWFDIIIVSLSFFGSFSAFRALRIFLLFSRFPTLQREIEVFASAIFSRNVGTIFALMMMVVSVAALVMSLQYGAVMPERFYGWHNSFATHFQLIVFDDWGSINSEMNEAIGEWTTIYLVIYSFIMLLISTGLVGVVYDGIVQARVGQKAKD